jgi:Ethanolamine utilization protein EutJ (predicted chaperonin)
MFSFGRHNETATYGAIIDIGSGSVGIGILKSDHEKKVPEIIFSHRELMKIEKRDDTEQEQLRRMRETLLAASLVFVKDGLQALAACDSKAHINRILVTCSSPWAQTISRNVSYEHDTEIKITKELVGDLIIGAEEEITENLEETAITGSLGLRIVERATVDVRINGYTVHTPVGLLGKNIELTHITGLLPEEVAVAVHEIQEKILPETTLSMHTYMLVIYCILRDLFPETDSLAIVDITGETTEIGIVANGVLIETVHAHYGSNTLLRNIAKQTGGSIEDAQSTLRAYDEGTVHDNIKSEVEAIIAAYEIEVTKTLKGIRSQSGMPHTVIVTALPQTESFFKNKIPSILKKVTNSSMTVLELKKSILNEIAEKENNDVFITLAGRFFHKLHGCGELESHS